MTPGVRRAASALLIAAAVVLASAPSPAVVILDSTWRVEGGAPGREADGFGAHVALANQPQFRAVLALDAADGGGNGVGSATWIGNDDRHGYVLTAAHNFDDAAVEDLLFRTGDGAVLRGERVWIHPDYQAEGEDCTGVDLAIVRLRRPVTRAGAPPLLYAGGAELRQTVTFVGYGTRGIASRGEDPQYNKGTDKAAAEGVVDEAVGWRPGVPVCQDGGNFLTVFLPREDGAVVNPFGGASRPVSRLAGLLGAGDSGGSAWMRLGDDWVVVGVNVSGDGKAQYGDNSWFARVSGVRDWIASIVPTARFTDGTPQAGARSAPEESPAVGDCPVGTHMFVLSEGAWFPATTRRPGRRSGSCVVRFDGYGPDEDETVGTGRMLPWSAEGPGRAIGECRPGAPVVAEEDGVWYPGTIARASGKGCLVRYKDEDYEDEVVPLRRLRVME